MTKNLGDNFSILSRFDEIAPFLKEVIRAADSQRDALGFFPEAVFHDAARRERLLVITKDLLEGRKYCGHLLFRPLYPRAHVLQIYTEAAMQRRGLASKLVGYLRQQLTHYGYSSIYARVADDLTASNKFWEAQGFYVQRVERGGTARNRQIHVRCHELDTPQLFPPSGIDGENPLGLKTSAKDVVPLYLLDLNVLFDVGPRRPRHVEAVSLFQAERSNFCRLAISTEIREELQRNAYEGRTDPMATYISLYPAFPIVDVSEGSTLFEELAGIVFPTRYKDGKLTANDRSDLKHVATAIEHDLAGLITNDGAILDVAQIIQDRFSIEVVSPSAFLIQGDASSANASFDTKQDTTLALREIEKEDEGAVRGLLSRLRVPGSSIASGWIPVEAKGRIATCCGVWLDRELIGYATWAAKEVAGPLRIRIAIDEASPFALNATRILLMYILERIGAKGSQTICLNLPENQSHVRELATGFGFHSAGEESSLTKLVLGNALTVTNWATRQAEMAAGCGLRLPVRPPQFRNVDQLIPVFTPDGNQSHVALDLLETLLFPALLCLPGRPAVLTPIQSKFATELLGGSPQASLLPQATATLFHDRHYLSDPRTLRHFKRGAIMLFYESTKNGGRAAVIAMARIRESYLRDVPTLDHDGLEHSVLSARTLEDIGKSKMKTVTVFDNIFIFPRQVPLSSLKRIGCGSPNSLITTRPITDAQLQEILREAFSSE